MRYFLFLASFLLLVCCSGEDEHIRHDGTVDYFKTNLHADMKYSEIVKHFGEPLKDIGSGIHIYVYSLHDGTQVCIGFTDKVLYARHLDEHQNLLEVIL